MTIAQPVWFTGGNICPTEPWKLVFHDEFDGTAIDTEKWYTYFPYDGNFGDQCQFCRTHSTENSQQIYRDENMVVSNGTLKIVQKNETASWMGYTANYTSGAMNSIQEFRTYSKYEIRCKIPSGEGFWPAFWVWTPDYEIDIFEFGGQSPDEPHLSIHNSVNGTLYSLGFPGIDYSQNFHTYAVEYDPFFIRYYIDDVLIHTMYRYSTSSGNDVIDYCNVQPGIYLENPQYPSSPTPPVRVIANVAIANSGIDFFGLSAPNANTVFPNQMEIDYIRVYQREPQAWLSDLCSISGQDLICSSQQATYSFGELSGSSSITWTTSSNLQIISQSSTAVVVRPVNSSINGAGWVRANIPNGPCPEDTYTKSIWIGKPNSPTINRNVNCGPCFSLSASSNPASMATYNWNVSGVSGSNGNYCGFEDEYTIPFSVEAVNSCGSTIRTGWVSNRRLNCGDDYDPDNGDIPDPVRLGEGAFSVFPNPASNLIRIQLNNLELNDIKSCIIISQNTGDFVNIPLGNLQSSIDISSYQVVLHYVLIETINSELLYSSVVIEHN